MWPLIKNGDNGTCVQVLPIVAIFAECSTRSNSDNKSGVLHRGVGIREIEKVNEFSDLFKALQNATLNSLTCHILQEPKLALQAKNLIRKRRSALTISASQTRQGCPICCKSLKITKNHPKTPLPFITQIIQFIP